MVVSRLHFERPDARLLAGPVAFPDEVSIGERGMSAQDRGAIAETLERRLAPTTRGAH